MKYSSTLAFLGVQRRIETVVTWIKIYPCIHPTITNIFQYGSPIYIPCISILVVYQWLHRSMTMVPRPESVELQQDLVKLLAPRCRREDDQKNGGNNHGNGGFIVVKCG